MEERVRPIAEGVISRGEEMVYYQPSTCLLGVCVSERVRVCVSVHHVDILYAGHSSYV